MRWFSLFSPLSLIYTIVFKFKQTTKSSDALPNLFQMERKRRRKMPPPSRGRCHIVYLISFSLCWDYSFDLSFNICSMYVYRHQRRRLQQRSRYSNAHILFHDVAYANHSSCIFLSLFHYIFHSRRLWDGTRIMLHIYIYINVCMNEWTKWLTFFHIAV